MEDKEIKVQDETQAEQTITEETSQVGEFEEAEVVEEVIKVEKQAKPKKSFDDKVDSTASFIKKYKIALLCGIVAIIALIAGIWIGGLFDGGNKEPASTPAPVATQTPKPAEISPSKTETPAPTATPTPAPVATPAPTATPAPEATATPIYYADLLESVAYFEKSEDLKLAKADVIDILNNVLQGEKTVVKAGDSEGVAKLADTVSVEVTKEEMLALLNDTNAKFVDISQSVSGDTLTLDVNMNIQIPEEVIQEVKNSVVFPLSLLISGLSSDLSFSYTVVYEMDGEKLVSMKTNTSTMDIANLGPDATEMIAGIALSKYSDAPTETLLVGYNNMAGEIIADILNNYAVVKSADSSVLNVTTRAK